MYASSFSSRREPSLTINSRIASSFSRQLRERLSPSTSNSKNVDLAGSLARCGAVGTPRPTTADEVGRGVPTAPVRVEEMSDPLFVLILGLASTFNHPNNLSLA